MYIDLPPEKPTKSELPSRIYNKTPVLYRSVLGIAMLEKETGPNPPLPSPLCGSTPPPGVSSRCVPPLPYLRCVPFLRSSSVCVILREMDPYPASAFDLRSRCIDEY